MQMLNPKVSRFRRDTRFAGVAVIFAAFIAMTACSSAPADTDSMMVGSTESEENREASVYFNKFRICIQNNTSGNLGLEWNSSMLTDQGEYLSADQLKMTLGPEAFSCAVSYASTTVEAARWTVAGYQMAAGVDSWAWYIFYERERLTLKSNVPVTQVLEGTNQPTLRFEASTNGVLRTFDQVKAYPIDVRFFDEPSQ